VQKLMSFSRVDQSEATSVDINECIETTLTMVRNEFEHTATIEKKYGKLPQTWCYPQLINQVFMNLLLNAGQAVEKQGAIIIRTWFEDGSILVAISDTGAGIPKENLSRIFEPFFTTREVGQGSGLGLSVAYDIIKKHNGDISVESEAGKGTTFTVRIPVHEKSDPPVKRERL
jgi:two-component system NtrC family sensor kinase